MTGLTRHFRQATNEDLVVTVNYVEDDGTPPNLTEAIFRAVRDDDGTEVFEVTPTQNGTTGAITGYVPAATFAGQTGGLCRYDMVIEIDNQVRVNVADGTFTLIPGVSQWPA